MTVSGYGIRLNRAFGQDTGRAGDLGFKRRLFFPERVGNCFRR